MGLSNKPRPGRPKCITSAADGRMPKIATSGDRCASLRAIVRHALTAQGTHPSHETVHARLASVGLKKRSPKYKHCSRRSTNKNASPLPGTHAGADWSGVAFHDEKKFTLLRSTKSVWHLPEEVVVAPQVKYPVSVNVWDACGRGGVGPIHIFGGNLITKMMRDIFVEDFLSHLLEITGMPEGPLAELPQKHLVLTQ